MENAEYMRQFGKNIAYHRQKINISRRFFSQICEIDESYVSRIEIGCTNITVKTVYKISQFLQISMKALMRFDRHKKYNQF